MLFYVDIERKKLVKIVLQSEIDQNGLEFGPFCIDPIPFWLMDPNEKIWPFSKKQIKID